MNNINQVNAHYYKVLDWALQEKNIEFYKNMTSAYRGARNIQYLLTLKNPLDLDKALKLAEPVALQCASDGVIIQRAKDKVSFQINLPESYWKNYYRGEHTSGLGIGLTDSSHQIEYNFEAPHSIWIGTTGAGKTFGAKASLLALFDTYSVEELRAVICDYHGDMSDFANEEHLFKFEWGTIADTMDSTVRAIKWTYNLMMKRIEDKNKDGIRILLFVDEVEAVAGYDKETLGRLVQIGNEGRKFNINLMVTAKHPKEENVPGLMATIDNRFVGRTTMGKAAMTRFIGQPIEAQYLTKKGDFIHSDCNELNRFLVVRIENKDIQAMKRTEHSLAPVVDDKALVFRPKQGRPEKPLDEELLAFLWLVGPDTFSNSLISKEWSINALRVDNHKEFIREFGEDYMRFRKLKKANWHPRVFNELRGK